MGLRKCHIWNASKKGIGVVFDLPFSQQIMTFKGEITGRPENLAVDVIVNFMC